MKILIICEGINKHSIIAQPWKHVYELARRMIHSGNYVELLTDSIDNSLVDDKINDVPIIKVKKRKFFFQTDQLLKHLNDEKFDIINWHGSDIWSTVHVWRVREKLKNNIIWTLHSGPLTINDIKNLKISEWITLVNFWNNVLSAVWPTSILKKWMNLPQIIGVITLSQRLKKYLIKKGIKDENRVKVIRSGVDVKKYNPFFGQQSIDDCFIGSKRKKVILYFGPASPVRGIDTLILAMQKVKKMLSSAKLLLLIRENHKTKVKWLEKKANKMDEVHIIEGILNEEALLNYLSLADIVALPFRFWPQVECPLTILEAMAMQKAIITTKVGAIPEIINDHVNGILVPPNNHKVLADAILELTNKEELAEKIGKMARKDVERFYSWDVIVKETLETFKKFQGINGD